MYRVLPGGGAISARIIGSVSVVGLALLASGCASQSSTEHTAALAAALPQQPAAVPAPAPPAAAHAQPASKQARTVVAPQSQPQSKSQAAASREPHIFAPRLPPASAVVPPPAQASIEPPPAPPADVVKTSAPVTPAPVATATAPHRPIRGLVTEFTLDQVTVYDRPYGQRMATISERDFPRTGTDANGAKGVPIYAVDGAVIEVALPGGRSGWINKATAITTVPPCQSVGPARTTTGKGGLVARGAGEASC